MIRFLPGFSLFMLFAQLDQLAGLVHCKALVQEGIDEQIDILLHMCNPPLIVQSGELPTLELPTLLLTLLLRCQRVKRTYVNFVRTERDAVTGKLEHRDQREFCRSGPCRRTPSITCPSFLLPTIHIIACN